MSRRSTQWQLHVTVNPEWRKTLAAAAEASGKTISTYAREAIGRQMAADGFAPKIAPAGPVGKRRAKSS